MSVSRLRFADCDPRRDPAKTLIDELSQELAVRYDFTDDGTAGYVAEDASAAGHAFVIAWLAEELIGCAALRPLEEGAAEVKRMYVRPAFRGRGFAGALLSELERRAREMGYDVVRLETANRQPEAIRVYQRAGYVRTAPFGYYANDARSLFFEKELRVDRDNRSFHSLQRSRDQP